MNKKVEYMAEHANDTKYIDPQTMLRQVLEQFQSGERTAKQVIVVTLDNEDGEYYTRFCSVGMKCSEVVALMVYMQDEMIRYMKESA